MADILNLDARRSEVLHTPKQVKLEEIVYDLPSSLPLVFGEYLAAGKFSDALGLLFGEHTNHVAPLLGMDDLLAIVSDLYDITVPE